MLNLTQVTENKPAWLVKSIKDLAEIKDAPQCDHPSIIVSERPGWKNWECPVCGSRAAHGPGSWAHDEDLIREVFQEAREAGGDEPRLAIVPGVGLVYGVPGALETLAQVAENIGSITAQELLTAIGHREGADWSSAIERERELIGRWWDLQEDKCGVIRDSALRLAMLCRGELKSERPGMVEFELLPILVHLGLVKL